MTSAFRVASIAAIQRNLNRGALAGDFGSGFPGRNELRLAAVPAHALAVTVRKLPALPGGRAWIDCTSSPEAAPGWPNGLTVTVIACAGADVTVRDAAGRELTLPYYSLDAGYEYQGRTGWVPETDPRVLEHLRNQREVISREKWDPAVDRNRADVIANIDAILLRNTAEPATAPQPASSA